MSKGVSCKHAKLISKIHSPNQKFHYANKSTMLKEPVKSFPGMFRNMKISLYDN